MQSSSIQNELFVVWACFLLLLLGSADTMTAFSFNDSSQQTRSMMNQTLHVVYLLFLILYYKASSAAPSSENQVVYEYMKYEPLNSAGIQGGSYDPKTMEEYIYLVDGEEVEKVDNGEVIKVSYKVPETVDVEKCPRVRLSTTSAETLSSRGSSPMTKTSAGHSGLGFLFDFFYARYPSIKDTLAPDLAVYIVILATSLFTLFSPDLLRYRPQGPIGSNAANNILIHGFNLDLLVTRLVIVWYIFLESYQFLAFIFSDWHKAFMEVPLKVLCHFTVTRYWKGTIGQYFILDNIQPHWVKTFLSWFSLEAQALDSSLMTRSVRLMPVVRDAVLRELKNCDGKITDGRMWMYRTGIIDLNLDRDVLLGHTYARYILTWHIATSICDYGLSMDTTAGGIPAGAGPGQHVHEHFDGPWHTAECLRLPRQMRVRQ
ncbi:hypothetical protein OsI_00353 [Oryza sativa Indica Group]|uniref:DUF4220 domain-containing protein n=1 Tax=Oryza sativa subsp. indica TaxID=39946 RepID=A2WKK0_ORYSI|nr:hypothetical protein OsI_00353 [Oryza sativa Indica Group]